jgi:hypothetical protein
MKTYSEWYVLLLYTENEWIIKLKLSTFIKYKSKKVEFSKENLKKNWKKKIK